MLIPAAPEEVTTMAEEKTLEGIAARHGVAEAVVRELAEGLRRTGGRQVQFSHPDLGGMGQWMPGMVMVGSLFDHALKARVDALVSEIAAFVAATPAATSATSATGANASANSGGWWPTGLGTPNASGSQNGIRYAYFAAPNRLAVERAGTVTLYDATGYRIGGVSQQQSGGTPGTLAFSSDRGPVPLDSLPIV